MRHLKRWLVRIGLVIARWGGYTWTVPPIVESVLLPRTQQLVREIEQTAAPGTSGEYKRHTVYARLAKEYPKLSKRDLGLAIELAVRGL